VSKSGEPFNPAWLDDLGLSLAEFRVFFHLCRRADNKTGIAWPSYESMTKTCGMGKSSVRRAIESLEKTHKLIASAGKPFGGSCRYRILPPIVPPEGPLEDSNSSATGTIEAAPIVPPQDCNSSVSDPPIVPPEGQEGSPRKVLQRRKSESVVSREGLEFADWFRSTLPASFSLNANWRTTFAEAFDDLVRIDKRSPGEIRRVSAWGRSSTFWSGQFFSPAKLRKRNKDGVTYFDVFAANRTSNGGSKPVTL
jgi:hypothetical protein